MDSARSTLQKIVAEAIKRLPPDQIPMAAWEFAAGRTVAEKTRPAAFADGVLTIEVPDATWRSQLTTMAPHFISALRQFNATEVDRLEFVVRKGNPQPQDAATQQ